MYYQARGLRLSERTHSHSENAMSLFDMFRSKPAAKVQANGRKIMTVEGLEQGGKLHPLQEGFHEKHALQCGYCTPGMMMTAAALLQHNPNPTEHEIRVGISGNLCRCTGYVNIVKAIQYAAEKLQVSEQVPVSAGEGS